MMKYSWKNKIFNLISCVIFLIIWQIAAVIINNNIYLPSITEIAKSIVEIIKDNNFFIIVFSTFSRTCISYASALVLAVAFGVLCFAYPFFNYVLMPFNSFFKTIPTLVLVVLSLIWFDKETTPYVVSFAIVFPIFFEGIKNCFKEVDAKIIEMTKIYEISMMDKIFKIYIPQIIFYLTNIFVSTFSLAFKVVVAGEVHGQPKYGIGSQIQVEKVNFNTSSIFAWIAIIIIISLILELINYILKNKVYRWKNESRN